MQVYSEDMVLDLSCHSTLNQPSTSPPTSMTSSPAPLRPEVESSRSRRHNRKSSLSSSSASMATASTGGRHDDHDDPLRWSVRDVIEFVSEVPGCRAYAEVRRLLTYCRCYGCDTRQGRNRKTLKAFYTEKNNVCKR